MDRQDKKYYVLSDNLSVQYLSNRHYFGVEKLDKVIEKDGYSGPLTQHSTGLSISTRRL